MIELYQIAHYNFSKWDEPIPSLESVNVSELENLVISSTQTYSGKDLYPKLEERAAFIFYKINKGHIFQNGNKRLSVYYLNVFLILNNKALKYSPEDFSDKALWLAQTLAADHKKAISELENWIKEGLFDIKI